MSSPVRLQRPRNLSLESAKPRSRVTFKEGTTPGTPPATNNSSLTRKYRYETEFRSRRKRAQSCSFSWDSLNMKRRKAAGAIVLPSKFLLGGNITDPLNLEALDEDDNKDRDESIGGSCRRGGTVRVIIPPNINDPLNLDACSEHGEEQLADAISRQRRRRKKRKRRNSEPSNVGASYCENAKRFCTSLSVAPWSCERVSLRTSEEVPPSTTKEAVDPPPPATASEVTPAEVDNGADLTAAPVTRCVSDPGIRSNDQNEDNSPLSSSAAHPSGHPATSRHLQHKKPRPKTDNKIVSPVVPQPGVERKRHCSHHRQPSVDKTPQLSQSHLLPPKHFHPKNALFQYGNYNQYYGYRNQGHKPDPRLKVFKKEWFAGKDVLDLGCNIGHITLSVGRDFSPHSIVGVDIDKKLVNIARKNVKHYIGNTPKDEDQFPSSMKLLYGPLKPPVDIEGRRIFPYNVKFYQSNYVLENDALLETIRPEFDTILCLSVTKWIHLNFGDEGLKRFFSRTFRNLRPGGLLVLEPQPWASYKKKRKLTAEIFENYKKIRIFPNKFGELLTSDVGFEFVRKISTHQHYSRGFDRPVFVYRKPSPLETKAPEIAEAKAGSSKNREVRLNEANSGQVQKSSDAATIIQAPAPSVIMDVKENDNSIAKESSVEGSRIEVGLKMKVKAEPTPAECFISRKRSLSPESLSSVAPLAKYIKEESHGFSESARVESSDLVKSINVIDDIVHHSINVIGDTVDQPTNVTGDTVDQPTNVIGDTIQSKTFPCGSARSVSDETARSAESVKKESYQEAISVFIESIKHEVEVAKSNKTKPVHLTETPSVDVSQTTEGNLSQTVNESSDRSSTDTFSLPVLEENSKCPSLTPLSDEIFKETTENKAVSS